MKYYQVKILNQLGVPDELISALFDAGLEGIQHNGVCLLLYTKDNRHATIEVKTHTLDLLIKGMLGESTLAKVQIKVFKAIHSLVNQQFIQQQINMGYIPDGDELEMEIKMLPLITPAICLHKIKAEKKLVPLVNIQDVQDEQWSSSSLMYCECLGSSTGSVYCIVAVGEVEDGFVLVAVRFKGGSLSLRVSKRGMAGNELPIDSCPKFVNDLKEVGLVIKNNTHASIHVSVGGEAKCNMVIGAIVLGLRMKVITPLPDIAKVIELGFCK